jgi:hypothetical protein
MVENEDPHTKTVFKYYVSSHNYGLSGDMGSDADIETITLRDGTQSIYIPYGNSW